MSLPYPGGVSQVRIADTEAFDTTDTTTPSTFVVVVDRDEIAKEGTDFPDPEKVTAALADDRSVGTGVDQSVALRIKDLPVSDGQSLQEMRQAAVSVFIEVSSLAQATDGTPLWVVTYKRVMLDHAIPGPVNFSRDTYGVFIVEGMTTGHSADDIFSVVRASSV